jgi:hypothetical protein
VAGPTFGLLTRFPLRSSGHDFLPARSRCFPPLFGSASRSRATADRLPSAEVADRTNLPLLDPQAPRECGMSHASLRRMSVPRSRV